MQENKMKSSLFDNLQNVNWQIWGKINSFAVVVIEPVHTFTFTSCSMANLFGQLLSYVFITPRRCKKPVWSAWWDICTSGFLGMQKRETNLCPSLYWNIATITCTTNGFNRLWASRDSRWKRFSFSGDENDYKLWEAKFLRHLQMLKLKKTILP